MSLRYAPHAFAQPPRKNSALGFGQCVRGYKWSELCISTIMARAFGGTPAHNCTLRCGWRHACAVMPFADAKVTPAQTNIAMIARRHRWGAMARALGQWRTRMKNVALRLIGDMGSAQAHSHGQRIRAVTLLAGAKSAPAPRRAGDILPLSCRLQAQASRHRQ